MGRVANARPYYVRYTVHNTVYRTFTHLDFFSSKVRHSNVMVQCERLRLLCELSHLLDLPEAEEEVRFQSSADALLNL